MTSWNPTDFEFAESQFAGEARLLPLPDLVLFPHVMQPLHIFESRYRALTESALESDGLIALATLEPGWEDEYEGRPPVSSTACLGKIVAHAALPDGRFNLLLLGLRRIRIAYELPPDTTYRTARVEVVSDIDDDDGVRQRDLQQALISEFHSQLPQGLVSPDHLETLTAQGVSLGTVTDVVSYVLPLDMTVKSELLAEPRVIRRAERLLSFLRQIDEPLEEWNRPQAFQIFPPPFSAN